MNHPYATIVKVLVNQVAKLAMGTGLGAPNRSRILMFHDIAAPNAPLMDEYACSLDTFERILDAYTKQGFAFVSLDALLDAPYAQVKEGHCVLTFDDGYASLFSLAAPLLFSREIPFTVYVATDYLDKPGYLTALQLKELSRNPLCTVGSHLVSHTMTRFLPASAVKREMLESREILSAITGGPVAHMAFPYGSAYACSLRDARLSKTCGYRSAALTVPANYLRLWPLPDHTLPRLNMPAQFDLSPSDLSASN